ncbi:hypothetical protein BGZ83_009158 [Gryganskiella cystojenkinii]|nr:hypothetical protein BGZ83_009158 [Gryganskiella cystojenkinii]
MTRPQTDNNAESDITTRRSTRKKAEPAPVAAAAAAVAKPKSKVVKPIKAPKTTVDVIESGEDEAEDMEEDEEEEEEEEPAQTSKRSTRARTSKTPAKNQASGSKTTRAPPSSKQAKEADTEKTSAEKDQDQEDDNDDEDQDEEDDEEDEDEIESSSSESELEDADSDFEEPMQQRSKAKSATTPKKPKTALSRISVIKRSNKPPKEPKAPKSAKGAKSTRKFAPRKTQTIAGAAAVDGEIEGETPHLYSAVLDPQTALDGVVEEWIEEYEKSNEESMLKLVNFLIRSCGCTQLISAEDFADSEMLEVLENVLLRYKENTANFDYPIISKAKEFKKFKKNLLEFFSRLIQKAQSEIMFDKNFMDTLLSWTFSLSSTTFRPVRHTSTVVGLNILSSLAEIASDIQDELNITSRQLATSQKQNAVQTKIRQLEKKLKEGKERQADVLKWSNEIFDSVFVLRCRDVDSQIRADCVRELGQWMTMNSEHFIASSYLQYLGWLLSDRTAAVRVETLKVLAKLYESDNQANALRQFTTRFTDRFIEMALGESDIAARQGAIRVATLIHKHGQLEEEDQVKLSVLIFGAHAKVRKALAKFVKARVWEDEVEGRMASCEVIVSSLTEKTEIKKDWIELKSLISFLIKVGKSEEGQVASGEKVLSQTTDTRLIDETKVGRIALAIEALWSEIEALKNWKSIAEYLIEDHSTAPRQPTSSRQKGPKATTLEDIYHLEEEEENILLEIFIASLQLTVQPPTLPGFHKDKAKVKAQQDELTNEVGRYCVDVLPKLFSKYGVDAARIRSILVIPQLIPLSVYLDMRILATYEELVDEVIKVFKKHTDTSVLSAAATTLRTMLSYEMLRGSHEAKIEALGASLVESFMVQISADDEMSSNDTLDELVPCLRRFEHLIKCTDLTGKNTRPVTLDPFDGLIKVIERNQTAHGEHAEILISALSIAFLWISWVCRALASKSGPDADWNEQDANDVLQKQRALLGVASDLAIKGEQEPDTRVRRRAFQVLGDLAWLFGGDMFHVSKGPNRHVLYLTCPEATQVECENFVRTELDLWAEKVQEKMTASKEVRRARNAKQNNRAGSAEDELADDEEEENAEELVELLEDEKQAAALVEQEEKHEMFGTVFSFMRQIILKDFSMKRATTVISQYGRFGAEFDEGVKRVVTAIKSQTSEGLSRQARAHNAEIFMDVCLDSLKQSFELYVDGQVRSTNQCMQLAKVLMTAIKPPGFMQQVRIGIDVQLIWRLHKQGIVYAMEKLFSCKGIDNLKKMSNTAKFFEILSLMLFGVQATSDQVATIRDVMASEAEKHDLTIDEEEAVWEPLRAYQSKLEKLSQKAVVENAARTKRAEETAAAAAAAAAAAQERAGGLEQQAQVLEDNDVYMVAATTKGDHDRQMATDRAAAATAVLVGKKRSAADKDDEDDEEVEEEEEDEESEKLIRRRKRLTPSDEADEAGSGPDSDAESQASFSSLTVKEAKRIRVT